MIEREKLTVTVKKDLIKKIDKIIDGRKIRNRSHATEFLIEEGLGLNKVNTAFILAGGEGTRLRPLTYEIPKPLIPVHGKPLLEHTLELLHSHGIDNVVMSLGYKAEKIQEYFGDGRRYGMNFTYIIEKEKLGTAGPLKLAKKYLTSTFIVLWADVLAQIDLDDFIRSHHENDGLITIALTSVDDVSSFGVVSLKGNKITGFVEKPKKEDAPSNLINAGLAICEPEVIDHLPAGKFAMFEKDIYPQLAEAGKVYGYPFEGQWFDTGTHEAYERVLKEWQK
jgi:NDP-sugar pyrophosphorylase family protein